MFAKLNILCCTLASFSFSLVADYFPLSVGNQWEYEGRFGTKKISIIDIRGDSIFIQDSTFAQSQSETKITAYVSDDFSGWVQIVWHTTLPSGTVWESHAYFGKHFIFDERYVKGAQTVKAGTFSPTAQFNPEPSIAGRPHFQASQYTLAPGVGLIKMQSSYVKGETSPAVWELSDFKLHPVPMGYAHKVSKTNTAPDSLFSYSPLQPDKGQLQFNLKANACAEFQLTTSYQPGWNCLRVYAANTNKSLCPGTDQFKHTVDLENMHLQKNLLVKVFFKEFRTDGLPNHNILYQEQINTGATGVAPPKTASHGLRPLYRQRYGQSILIAPELLENPVNLRQLVIYTAKGRLVRKLRAGYTSGGRGKAYWDGRELRGVLMPPGAFLLKLERHWD